MKNAGWGLALLAALCLAAGGAAFALRDRDRGAEGGSRAPAAAAPRPGSTSTSAPAGDEDSGPVLDEVTHVLLFDDGGDGVRRIDVDARRVEDVGPSVVPVEAERFVLEGRPHAVVVEVRRDTGDYPGDVLPVYAFAPDFKHPPVLIGQGNDALPSLHADRMWLIDQTVAAGDLGPSTVTEVDLTGRVTAGPQQLPCCGPPLADMRGGLVVTDGKGRLDLWSLAKQGVRRTITRRGELIAASSTLAAWVPYNAECDGGGPLHLTDVVTGRDRVIGTRDSCAYSGYGTFSPDGRTLVVGTPHDGAAIDLHSVDLRTGALRPIRYSTTAESGFAWSPDGRWLFFAEDLSHVRAWRVGTTVSKRVDVDFGRTGQLVSAS